MHMPLVETLESRLHLTAALNAIANQQTPGGKAILVPLIASSNTSPVTFSTTSTNAQVTATPLQNLSFVDMDITIDGVNKGTMRFALFGSIAPKTVARITQLVNSGFYDHLSFHRVIQDFMAQGGDPSGNGTGGSGTTFDDEFNANAIFSTTNLLAMANSGKDTNDSQFFVTQSSQATLPRHLDFQHTIFGILLRGHATLDAVMSAGITSAEANSRQQWNATHPGDIRPMVDHDIRISDARMVTDTTDGVLLVKGHAGSSTVVTVKATDSNSAPTRTFGFSEVTDSTNDVPFLNPVSSQQTPAGTPLNFNVSATDIDGGTITLDGYSYDETKLTLTKNGGIFTVTPAAGFVGTAQIMVGVYQYTNSQNQGVWDTQKLNVTVFQPFAQYNAATRALLLTGTSGNDNLQVSVSGIVLSATLNGNTQTFDLSTIGLISADLGAGNDIFTAGVGVPAVSVNGGTGNDYILGGDGKDTLIGADGNDTLIGAKGGDRIQGGIGQDSILAGKGLDYVLGGTDSDYIKGGEGNDYIEGKGFPDTIYGDAGDDTLLGGAYGDLIYGGDGNDRIDVGLAGVISVDTVYGGAGTDSVLSDGNDLLFETEVRL